MKNYALVNKIKQLKGNLLKHITKQTNKKMVNAWKFCIEAALFINSKGECWG